MNIALVVFDMAGTTVAEGGAVYRCLAATLAAHGVTVTDTDMHRVMGTSKREALQVLIDQSPERHRLASRLEAIHAEFVDRMTAFYESDPSVGSMPGSEDVFLELRRRGLQVAVNTGYPRAIAQMLIDRLGWERHGLIDASVASDEVERGRPHPFMIRHLMRTLNVADPQQVAKVGDTPADLQEGRNAGCGLVIGITTGGCTREQLLSEPHDQIIDSLTEIPALVAAV